MAKSSPWTSWLRAALAGLASAAVAAAFLQGHVWPLDAIAYEGSDDGLMAWNLWVVNEAVRAGRDPFFTDLVYVPLGAWLGKHTLVSGLWPVTFAADLLTGDDPRYPLVAYRASILLSFAVALGATFRLARETGASALAAALPAVQFAFAPFARAHVPHLNHVTAVAFLPVLGLALLALWRRPSTARAAGTAALLALGGYFTELVAFVALALALALGLALGMAKTRPAVLERARALGRRGLLAAAVAFLIVATPLARTWARDQGIAPQPRQVANWGANLAAFVVPSPEATPLYGALFAGAHEGMKGIRGHEAFLGFPLLLLAAAALARRPRAPWTAVAALVAVAFVVLAVGPVLKVGGANAGLTMPYRVLMSIPPFDMGRTPVRCVLVSLFALALLAAHGLQWLREVVERRGGRAAGTLVAALAVAWGAAEVYTPGPFVRPYTVPPELQDVGPGVVANVPLTVFDGTAVLLQVFHGQPIVTGFVSRRTPEQVEHVKALDAVVEADTPAFAARLHALGVKSVILGPGAPRDLLTRLPPLGLRVIDLRRLPP